MHSLPLLRDLVIRIPATHQLSEVTSDEDRARGEQAYAIERRPGAAASKPPPVGREAPAMRDRFASWLCSRTLVWALAEKGGGRWAVRLDVLCRARAVGIPVSWGHLLGRCGINDVAAAGHTAQGGECRHA